MLRVVMTAAVLGALTGCAALAVRVPTPANQLTREQLESPPPPPGERYYGIVFGSQAVPIVRPAHTHTWITVVKATESADGRPPDLQVDTISWLPSTLEVRPLRFRVEPGRNVPLRETLDWAKATGQDVVMFGPYELQVSRYRRVMIHKAFMESGRVGYQMFDSIGEAARTGLGCDCFHAVTDMEEAYPRRDYPLVFSGHSATRRLTYEAARIGAFIDPWTTHDWLITRLGLDQTPISRQPQPYRGVRPIREPD